jgi:polyphosphate kinase
MQKKIIFNRELSWLSFNYRVLQEAKDKNVPLYERIKFLAIYSSNLDEFFRVRVASLRSLLRLKRKAQNKLDFDPEELLADIHKTVFEQQEEFGDIFRNQILPELEKEGINLIDEEIVSEEQKKFLSDYFEENIYHHIQPVILVKKKIKPFLKNRNLYLVVKLADKKSISANDPADKQKSKKKRYTYALIEIPTSVLPRFVELPEEADNHYIIFLDDILRLNLNKIFEAYDIVEAYSVKLNRDADLYIDDEFTGNLLQKIKKGIKKRDTGVPSRFLYDQRMPKRFLNFLKESLELENEDLVAGAKYHNFNDFFSFPNPLSPKFENKKLKPVDSSLLTGSSNIFETISSSDIGLHFPYQPYDYVVRFIRDASKDPEVTAIKITQYRVADNSEIVLALINAARSGKDVTAFVEVKARFDEELNFKWAEEMEKAGVKVYYSFPGLKVHAKIACVSRKEKDKIQNYCYLGTGNFNEKTARIYADFGLLTRDERITYEVEKVFEFLTKKKLEYEFEHLLVAQFNMRSTFLELIDKEIKNAKNGLPAKIILKMNSLEDKKMIKRLYKASRAGVEIIIIVRGICCLVPGVKGLSKNIRVISIIDRYLEHARFYIFHNNGEPLIYAASADWMKRNLSRRIEVAFPIYDKSIRQGILDMVEIQLNDNTKARIIDAEQSNKYQTNSLTDKVRSQTDTYKLLERLEQK